MLFAFFAGAMAAQVYSGGDNGIAIESRYAWPLKVERGYVPVEIRVDNSSKATREIRIELIESYGYSANTSRTVVLEPGERRTLEFLLPGYLDHSAQHSLTVFEGNDWITSLSSIGPYERSTDGRGSVLLVSASEPDYDSTYAWVDRLVLSDINAIGAVGFEDLPKNQGAYSSLGLVILDVRDGTPAREELEPITSWVRLGGSLVVVGDEGPGFAAADDLLSPWMEERFAWTPWLESGLLPGLNSRSMGLGQLAFLSEEELDQPLIVSSVVQPAWSSPLSRRLPRGPTGNDPGALPVIPGVGHLPRGAFALLIFGIAILLGPVNAFVVRLLKRPASLLATTPIIALSSTAVMVGYGIAHNGLGVRTASHSMTMLDQRTHTAATHNVRQLYIGFSPRGGLRPAAETLHFPVSPDWDFNPQITWEQGRVLGGDLAPVRTGTRQVVLSEGSARQRLDLVGDEAANALGADILTAIVRTDEGWFLIEDLEEGDSAVLEPIEDLEPELAMLWESEMATKTPSPWPDRAMDWPVGTYVARIETSPFLDTEGVEVKEEAGEHWVVGVMEDS